MFIISAVLRWLLVTKKKVLPIGPDVSVAFAA
jgi:hypothetical protein